MSKSNAYETAILALIFNATAFADLAQDDGSSPATNLYVSLHTADPGEAGTQSTNETAYTNYVRVAVARTAGGWTVASGTVTNVAAVLFAACGVTGATITHFGIGVSSAGAGVLLYKAAITAGSLVVTTGVAPEFAIGEIDISEE